MEALQHQKQAQQPVANGANTEDKENGGASDSNNMQKQA
jgi:hypothetical protein